MGKLKLRGKLENIYPEPQVVKNDIPCPDLYPRIDMNIERININPRVTPWRSTERRLEAQISDEVVRDMNEGRFFSINPQRLHISGVTFLNEGSGVTVEDIL